MGTRSQHRRPHSVKIDFSPEKTTAFAGLPSSSASGTPWGWTAGLFSGLRAFRREAGFRYTASASVFSHRHPARRL